MIETQLEMMDKLYSAMKKSPTAKVKEYCTFQSKLFVNFVIKNCIVLTPKFDKFMKILNHVLYYGIIVNYHDIIVLL